MTIWKFPFDIAAMQVVKMPKGAKILSAEKCPPEFCLFALVDEEHPHHHVQENRTIYVIGTGRPITCFEPDECDFIGTIQNGPLVFHVFTPKTSYEL